MRGRVSGGHGRRPARAGSGSLAALRLLVDAADAEATRSAGRALSLRHGRRHPGGAGAPTGSPRRSTRSPTRGLTSPSARGMEEVAVDWLRELFQLPDMVGRCPRHAATQWRNFTGLAAARALVGAPARRRRQGGGTVRAAAAVPGPRLAGIAHASAVQGAGDARHRSPTVRTLSRDRYRPTRSRRTGSASYEALPARRRCDRGCRRAQCRRLRPDRSIGGPGSEHTAPGCMWMARSGCSPRFTPRLGSSSAGWIEADSVAVDGHKWLNVPDDCGIRLRP